jgi:hypothetical protein
VVRFMRGRVGLVAIERLVYLKQVLSKTCRVA